jgi:hypothetical protein
VNRKLIAMLGIAVLFGAITCSAPTGARAAANPLGSPAVSAPGAQPAGQGMEPHPQIRMALRHLVMARQRLENSAEDFGGHRRKALQLTNRAIEELHKALAYDSR